MKSNKWIKNLNLADARALSEQFCKDFGLTYCQIYYVDILGNDYGQYYYLHPPHILIVEECYSKISILMHELTHHLECKGYTLIDCKNGPKHGYYYQLAKHKVVSWCRKNISDKPNWYEPLRAYQRKSDLLAFKL